MNIRTTLLFASFLLAFSGRSSAQIVGTDCFLQGQWLEVGVNPMAGFGTCSSPATYHAHNCCGTTTPFTPGVAMDASYDWGHDGWSAGSPALMGPYTQPGYPQEGWSVQVGATEYRNGGWGGTCGTAFAVPGTHVSYSAVGGNKVDNWVGNVAGLNITQQTRVDTMASWAVITVVLRNTTAAPIAGVWYERTCDPDNTSFWNGTPTTRNIIVHQNEDATHKVQVSANGETPASSGTPAYNATNSYLAYVAKDCRARCGVIGSLSPSNTPSQLWTNTLSVTTPVVLGTLHSTNYNDEGIYMVFNIGTIAANDSAVLSYAYVYNGDAGIDSALPDPQIVINGVPQAMHPADSAEYDTFNVCLYPGMTDFPVDILNGDDKGWSFTHWTWSPGTGLASTTGVHNIITTSTLPATITYTITGEDTTSSTCNFKVFYLTVLTCNGATVNSPCEGDTLKFNAPGDSTAATYQWFGPYPSTTIFGVTQRVDKYPAALSDTGTYTVIKYVGGVPVDTATTYANIHPLPNPIITTNQVNCAPIVGYLTLTETPDSLGDLYAWSGPNGYTATNRLDTLFGFDSTYAGTYSVLVTSRFGCKNTASIDIFPGVIAEFDTTKFPGCPNDTVIFMNLTSDANAYLWNFGDGTTSTDRNPPPHIYSAPHVIHTISMTASNAHCSSTKTHTVDVRHDVTAMFSLTDTICNGSALNITDLSGSTEYGVAVPTLASQSWSYGDGGTDATNGAPAIAHTYASEGIYQIKLVVTDNLQCMDSTTKNVYVLQPYIHSISPDTLFCLTSPLPLYNTEYTLPTALNNVDDYGYTYSWSPSDHLSDPTAHVPFFSAVGTYTYVLTATLNHFGCVAMDTVTLNSVLPAQLYNVTAGTTIAFGSSINLNADSELNYTWTPNDGSLDNPNVNNPVATPTVTTTYTVYGMDYYGCRDTAIVTIVVDSTQTEFNPTAFTPNGDGLNDVFRLVGAKYQRLVEMRVFNRWGECVFSTNDKAQGWDGTYKGVPQDMGTYNYSVIVARPGYGDNIVYKGTVVLIR